MNKKFHIHTFGCQMNVNDSEKIAGILTESGYGQADSIKEADIVVINTCSIREKAEQKFYSELGRLKAVKNMNPNQRIAVAGCIAQQKGKALLERFPYIDFIFSPQNIDGLEKWINNRAQTKTALGHNPEYHLKPIPAKRVGQVRAWVSIMYGCDNFCSYCVVPYTRGRERSRPSADIYNEVYVLAKEGFKEITFLGQNVNSYGKNFMEKIDFPDLLKIIHDINGIERIRFVTSHPKDLSKKLINSMKDLSKICNHIHLPIQAGSDRILQQMNRGYTYEQYKEKVAVLRDAISGIAITTDIIVGFPGETDEDFRCTLAALTEIEFDGIFAFNYSPRTGTRAIDLSNHIDEKTKSERLHKVLNLQKEITLKKNRLLESETVQVLVEGKSETDKDKLTGRTTTNKIINFYGDYKCCGNLVMVKILRAGEHSLYGELV